MAGNIDIYLDKQRVTDSLSFSTPISVGLIISTILNSYRKRLNIKSNGEEIVKNPPEHSNLSFLWLGRRNRRGYLLTFNLAHVAQFRQINLDSSIIRKLHLNGQEKDIPDITLDNVKELHVFTSINDWTNVLSSLESIHCNTLIQHHLSIKAREQQSPSANNYRAENQRLRRLMADRINALLEEPCPSSSTPPATRTGRIRAALRVGAGSNSSEATFTSERPRGKVGDNKSRQSGSKSAHGRRSLMSRLKGKTNAQKHGSRRGGVPGPGMQGYQPPAAAGELLNTSVNKQQADSNDEQILSVLTNPDHAIAPASNDNSSPNIDGIEYISDDELDDTDNDHEIAVALYQTLNEDDAGGEAINRLAKKGIAVDAITGQPIK